MGDPFIFPKQDAIRTRVAVVRPAACHICTGDGGHQNLALLEPHIAIEHGTPTATIRPTPLTRAKLIITSNAMQLVACTAPLPVPKPHATIPRLATTAAADSPDEADQPRHVPAHKRLHRREAVAQYADVDLHGAPDRGGALGVEHVRVVYHGTDVGHADARCYDGPVFTWRGLVSTRRH